MRRSDGLIVAIASVFAGVALLLMSGCEPVVLPPSQHAPLSAGEVKLYQKQPAKYEALGVIVVEVTPEMQWNERGESVAGFDALKSKAGAMGGNGVLLMASPGTFDLLATTGYHGEWYQVPIKLSPKRAVAQAIFVINEK